MARMIDRLVRAMSFGGSSWFDPAAINANTIIRSTKVACAMNTPTIIAPASVDRWGIGLFKIGTGSVEAFGPWTDVDDFTVEWTPGNLQVAMFTLQAFGPLVGSQWWARSGFGATIRVVEYLRK